MTKETAEKLVEAFEYAKTEDVRRVIRTIVGFALQFGLGIEWRKRGNMRFAFRIGPGPHPEFVVSQHWVSVYTRPTDPLRMSSMDDFTVAVFPKSVRRQFGYSAEARPG